VFTINEPQPLYVSPGGLSIEELLKIQQNHQKVAARRQFAAAAPHSPMKGMFAIAINC